MLGDPGQRSWVLECMSLNQRDGGCMCWSAGTGAVLQWTQKSSALFQRSPGPSGRAAVRIFTLFQLKGRRRWRKITRRTNDISCDIPSCEILGFGCPGAAELWNEQMLLIRRGNAETKCLGSGNNFGKVTVGIAWLAVGTGLLYLSLWGMHGKVPAQTDSWLCIPCSVLPSAHCARGANKDASHSLSGNHGLGPLSWAVVAVVQQMGQSAMNQLDEIMLNEVTESHTALGWEGP